jgi:hypothetical protein
LTDDMVVSTGLVRQSAAELSATADAIGLALSQFSSAVSVTQGAFGTDTISGPFASEYGPLVNQAVTAITSYQDQLTYAARGLSLASSLLEHSETAGAADLARLRGQWRPSPGP